MNLVFGDSCFPALTGGKLEMLGSIEFVRDQRRVLVF